MWLLKQSTSLSSDRPLTAINIRLLLEGVFPSLPFMFYRPLTPPLSMLVPHLQRTEWWPRMRSSVPFYGISKYSRVCAVVMRTPNEMNGESCSLDIWNYVNVHSVLILFDKEIRFTSAFMISIILLCHRSRAMQITGVLDPLHAGHQRHPMVSVLASTILLDRTVLHAALFCLGFLRLLYDHSQKCP